MNTNELKYEAALGSVRKLLEFIGEDPSREGLLETPERVVRAYMEMFAGYKQNPDDLFKTFESDGYDELVLIKDIDFTSTCEHHLMPFMGVAHIAYIPFRKVIGLSKVPRLLEIYAKRLQIQERLCQQVVSTIMSKLKPLGAACIIEASHGCMVCRGVKKQNTKAVTSALAGVFKENVNARSELLSLISRR